MVQHLWSGGKCPRPERSLFRENTLQAADYVEIGSQAFCTSECQVPCSPDRPHLSSLRHGDGGVPSDASGASGACGSSAAFGAWASVSWASGGEQARPGAMRRHAQRLKLQHFPYCPARALDLCQEATPTTPLTDRRLHVYSCFFMRKGAF